MGIKGVAKQICSLRIFSNFSASHHLYSNASMDEFLVYLNDVLALSDFTTRFCILEPFCSTQDRCRTGRARIPRMPYLSLFVLRSLFCSHIHNLLLYLQHVFPPCQSVVAVSHSTETWLLAPAGASLFCGCSLTLSLLSTCLSLFGRLILYSCSLLENYRCVTISLLLGFILSLLLSFHFLCKRSNSLSL